MSNFDKEKGAWQSASNVIRLRLQPQAKQSRADGQAAIVPQSLKYNSLIRWEIAQRLRAAHIQSQCYPSYVAYETAYQAFLSAFNGIGGA